MKRREKKVRRKMEGGRLEEKVGKKCLGEEREKDRGGKRSG
jgi:hypothetical protein